MSTQGPGEPKLNPIVELEQAKVAEKAHQQAISDNEHNKKLDEEIDQLIAELRVFMGKR